MLGGANTFSPVASISMRSKRVRGEGGEYRGRMYRGRYLYIHVLSTPYRQYMYPTPDTVHPTVCAILLHAQSHSGSCTVPGIFPPSSFLLPGRKYFSKKKKGSGIAAGVQRNRMTTWAV